VLPCAALALCVNEAPWLWSGGGGLSHWLFEAAWAFSIYLEAIAILPQLIIIRRERQVENIESLYIASLGAYRFLYVLNWAWRAFTEPHYRAWIPWVAGVVQTLFYADFFYLFYQYRIKLGLKAVLLPTTQ
jgi:ER lumen protein retaining receptor